MLRLSIIIPMYNVAPYVERCIRSLEDQDISKDEYEIICVNDGSPDNCREIVESLQHMYSNIILINQENKGVSQARNNGIDEARGKYLMFIDPDDYVYSNRFCRILQNADDKAADVAFLGYTLLDGNGEIRYRAYETFRAGLVYCGMEAYKFTRGDGRTDPDRMWAILYKRDFLNINHLRFLPDVPYLEDGELIVRILCLAERCIFDGHSFYQRITRDGSATHSKLYHSEKALNGFLIAASNLKRFQSHETLNGRQKEFLNQPIIKFVLVALNSSCGLGVNNRFNATVRRLRELNLRRVETKGCNHKEIGYYGMVYNLSPRLAAYGLLFYIKAERLIELLTNKKI